MLDLSALVPECYAQFRPLIRDGLDFILLELSAERRTAVIAEQTRMASSATLEQRTVALLQHCPLLHKLGQVLARHPELEPELRTQLQRLESLPPRLTVDELRPVIESELGAEAGTIELGATPLAEGSVAVVVPFSMREPRADAPADGVLKILKPGIEALVEQDLIIADKLGVWLEARSAALGLPPLGYGETFAQIAGMLRAELCLDREREHLAAANRLYDRESGIRIPLLLPFHGPRITAMERIDGDKITDAGPRTPRDRQRLARKLVEALLAKPFFSDTPAPLFHGDPHAGNLFVDEDGRIVIIDWSLVGTLDGHQRHALIVILIGALILNRRRIRQGLSELVEGPCPEDLIEREVERAMEDVPWGGLPGFDWLLTLLDRLALAGASFAPEFTVFRKALFTLNGVFNDISAEFSIDLPIARSAALQFYFELGLRLFDVTGRRRFGIQLTNLELMILGVTWPVTLTRYWADGLQFLGRRMASAGTSTE